MMIVSTSGKLNRNDDCYPPVTQPSCRWSTAGTVVEQCRLVSRGDYLISAGLEKTALTAAFTRMA